MLRQSACPWWLVMESGEGCGALKAVLTKKSGLDLMWSYCVEMDTR